MLIIIEMSMPLEIATWVGIYYNESIVVHIDNSTQGKTEALKYIHNNPDEDILVITDNKDLYRNIKLYAGDDRRITTIGSEVL